MPKLNPIDMAVNVKRIANVIGVVQFATGTNAIIEEVLDKTYDLAYRNGYIDGLDEATPTEPEPPLVLHMNEATEAFLSQATVRVNTLHRGIKTGCIVELRRFTTDGGILMANNVNYEFRL